MGAYLSKPNCEKSSEDFDGEFLRFGASSMQGWRISQEDAHCCIVDYDKGASLFGVYDGHGGSEVAQYTAEKFPDFLKTVPAYNQGDMTSALKDAFLGFDDTLTKDDVKQKLAVLASGEKDGGEADEEEEEEAKNEAVMLKEEAVMPIEKLLERYGGGAVQRINDLIKTDAKKILSPVIRPKQDKASLEATAESSPNNGHDDSVKSKPENSVSLDNCTKNDVCVKLTDICDDVNGEKESDDGGSEKKKCDDDISLKCDSLSSEQQNNGQSIVSKTDTETDVSGVEVLSSNSEEKDVSDKPTEDLKESGCSAIDAQTSSSSSSCCAASSSTPGISSTPKSSDEETTEEEEDSEDDEQWKEEEDDSDDDDVDGLGLDDDDSDEDDDDDNDDDDAEEVEEGMNFGEEPGADSGCTAVVALLHGKTLYVANAGDSRCVLCRAGKAVEMSVDHKPEDAPEQDRILKAGGRVTADGRVNGGLNLSRAIGDHIYKRNTAISASEQMITSLPDVISVTLDEQDQFMVLACDGIWNVMSSQDVVDFVSRRLESGVTKLSAICEEMFDFCLAPDTTGDGTGCDNMTCVIVTFRGQSSCVVQRTGAKRKAETPTCEADEETETALKRLKEDI